MQALGSCTGRDSGGGAAYREKKLSAGCRVNSGKVALLCERAPGVSVLIFLLYFEESGKEMFLLQGNIKQKQRVVALAAHPWRPAVP